MTDSSIRTREDIARLDGRKLESIADSWIQVIYLFTITVIHYYLYCYTTNNNNNNNQAESSNNDFGNMNKNSTWDQFEVNKVKFGVKSTFDENVKDIYYYI